MDVTHPVASMAKLSDKGFGLWIPPYGGQSFLVRDNGQENWEDQLKILLERVNDVFMMKATRAPASDVCRGLVAPLTDDMALDQMLHPVMDPQGEEDVFEQFDF